MKKYVFIFSLFLLITQLSGVSEFRSITSPTYYVLDRGDYSFETEFYGNSSMRLSSYIGLFERLSIGVSYGAENFVGNKKPDWYDQIDFKAKFQILRETINIPGLSIGFDSEGHGIWVEHLNRYAFKSPGFYAVIGKSDLFLKGSNLNLGVNKSTENDDGDKDINSFLSFSQSIGEDLNFTLEYDFAFNDNKSNSNNELEKYGEGKGYLNFAVGWYIIPDLQFKFSFYDILSNAPNFNDNQSITIDRSFQIVYTTKF